MEQDRWNLKYVDKRYKKRIIIREIMRDMNMKDYELELYIEEHDLFDDTKFFILFKNDYEKELNKITDKRISVNKIINDIKKMEKESLINFAVFPNEAEKYKLYLNGLLRKEKIKKLLKEGN